MINGTLGQSLTLDGIQLYAVVGLSVALDKLGMSFGVHLDPETIVEFLSIVALERYGSHIVLTKGNGQGTADIVELEYEGLGAGD